MKSVLLFIKDSDQARATAKEIHRFLLSRRISAKGVINRPGLKFSALKGYELMIVVGGDGTFLAGARIASRLRIPILGVNEGRFGFLTEIDKSEAPDILEELLKGRLKRQRRIMLSTYLLRNGMRKFLGDYLNDVVVSKSAIARITEIEVYADENFMVHIYGDGVIVSTPTGSTAYALSAGGPIIHPDSDSLLLVPICPHTLSNRPVVLPSKFSVRLRVLSGNRACYLTMDGQEGMYLKKRDIVEVKKSKRFCEIYLHPEKDFFAVLRRKLRWG